MPAKPAGSTLSPEGSLTIFEVASFKRQLQALLDGPDPRCVDLSAVTSIDTSCVQLLLAARRSEQGRTVEIRGVSPGLRRHFERLDASTALQCSSSPPPAS